MKAYRGNNEADIIEQERVHPGEVGHPAADDTTERVGDTDDGQQERRLGRLHTL